MSRSRKKTPSYSSYSRNYTSWAKRQSNKVVRRYPNGLTDGCFYKKLFPSWDIFDYKGVWFANEDDDWITPRKAYSK